jgi:hypothetical protein
MQCSTMHPIQSTSDRYTVPKMFAVLQYHNSTIGVEHFHATLVHVGPFHTRAGKKEVSGTEG